jgi:uncharacterized protein
MKTITDLDHPVIVDNLNMKGYAIVKHALLKTECEDLCRFYDNDDLYRSTINMQRYRFGQGEYKYFNYPLPAIIRALREMYYPILADVANDWMLKLGLQIRYSLQHHDFLEMCAAKGQLRPTPLILRYDRGGFNTLHQDIYGEIFFPFQIVFALTQQGIDHEGGEFVLTEQIPRAQSRAHVLQPGQGDAIIFTTNFRPVNGSKGYYRATMKHGISEVKSGTRYSLGIIFHDAL